MQPDLSFSDCEHLGMVSTEHIPVVVYKKSFPEPAIHGGDVINEATLVDVVQTELVSRVLGVLSGQRIEVGDEIICVARLRECQEGA